MNRLILLSLFFLVGLTAFSQVKKHTLYVQFDQNYHFFYNLKEDLANSKELAQIFEEYPQITYDKTFRLNNPLLSTVYTFHIGKENSETIRKRIEALHFVNYAEYEPDYDYFYNPDDYSASVQWSLNKINAPAAWDVTTGSASVVIAIVDDAVSLSHDDIKNKLWVNTGEIAGNGIDDDGNGFVDDINGWDGAESDEDPNPDAAAVSIGISTHKHGTHVASIAAAQTDNGIGMASIGFNTKIMALKGSKATFPYNIVFSGMLTNIEYAIINEADIISMSWGGSSYSITLQNLLTVAHDSGIVNVAAAGNYNNSLRMYPASYAHVISVAASDSNDYKSTFSTYNDSVDITAPGTGILGAYAINDSSYSVWSGTSMAAPMVSGLLALMKSIRPSATPDVLEHCLKSTATEINSLNPAYAGELGAGRIDAFNAVRCLKPLVASFYSLKRKGCINDSIQFFDSSYGQNTVIGWEWNFPGGSPGNTSAQNPAVSYDSAGKFDVELIVYDGVRYDTFRIVDYIIITSPIAVLSGNRNIKAGQAAHLKIDFTGEAPYSVKVSDGFDSKWVHNIYNNPYYHVVVPYSDTTYYSIDSMYDKNCFGTSTGSASVIFSYDLEFNLDCYEPEIIQKISDTQGNFTASFSGTMHFGSEVDTIGDLDNDGVMDLVVAANWDHAGSVDDAGSIFVLFMNSNGTVKSHVRITNNSGGLPNILGDYYYFGSGVACIGDINGDNVNDIAVGAYFSDEGGGGNGAVYILFMKNDGTVDSYQKISKNSGGMGSAFPSGANFGVDVSLIGDINNDGVNDVLVGAHRANDGGNSCGSAYVLRLKPNGTVMGWQKIANNSGGFGATLSANARMGTGNTGIPDITGDGIPEILIGAHMQTIDGSQTGAAYLCTIDSSGYVTSTKEIATGRNGFNRTLSAGERFGQAARCMPDITGDGVPEVVIGAGRATVNASQDGRVYILSIGDTLQVKQYTMLDSDNPGLASYLAGGDNFGFAVVGYTANDRPELVITAWGDDDGGNANGAVYIVKLNDSCSNNSIETPCFITRLDQKVSDTRGGFNGTINSQDRFAQSIDTLGDLDGDGIMDYIVGMPYDDNVGGQAGAVFVLFMNANGTVNNYKELIAGSNGVPSGMYGSGDVFGWSVAGIGDLDGDGVNDAAIGAYLDDDGATDAGAVYILFMKADGTVKGYQKISSASGNFSGYLSSGDNFGISVAAIGDINEDSVMDIIVGASESNDGGTSRGAAYVLRLNPNGTVKGVGKISANSNGFGDIAQAARLGRGVASYQDMNSDGVPEVLIGVPLDTVNGIATGAVYLTYIDSSGTSLSAIKYAPGRNGFQYTTTNTDRFGLALNSTYDLNGDGQREIIMTAINADVNSLSNSGGVFVVFPKVDGTVSTYFQADHSKNAMSSEVEQDDHLGTNVASFMQNDTLKFLISTSYDGDGGTQHGAFYQISVIDSCAIADSCEVVADFDFEGFCINDSFTFRDQSELITGKSIINGTWIFENDTIQADSLKYKFKTGGTKTVGYTSIAVGGSVCRSTIYKQIEVADSLIISADTFTVCRFDSLEIPLSHDSCNTRDYNYSWSPTTGLSSSTVLNPIVNVDQNTTYTLEIETPSKVYSFDIAIIVDSSCCKSKADFSIGNGICPGDSITPINQSISNGGSPSYSWNFDLGATPASSTAENPGAIVYDQFGDKEIQLIINDACGSDTVKRKIQVYQLPALPEYRDTSGCIGDTIMLDLGEFYDNNIRIWTPASIVEYDNNGVPYHVIAKDTHLVLSVYDGLTGCVSADTYAFTISSPVVFSLGNDTIVCDSVFNIIPDNDTLSYRWQNGQVQDDFAARTSGKYWADVAGVGCISGDTIEVELVDIKRDYLPDDTASCDEPIVLELKDIESGANVSWSNGSNASSITVAADGEYSVRVTKSGCSMEDTVQVSIFPIPNGQGSGDSLICDSGSVIITVDDLNSDSIIWADGSRNYQKTFASGGTYYYQLYGNGCVGSDSVRVWKNSTPDFFLGNDTLLCTDQGHDNIYLGAGGIPGFYTWNDGSTNSTKFVTESGTYWVTVTNSCGSASDTIDVEIADCECVLFLPNAFSPNGDGVNDDFGLYHEQCNATDIEFYIYNRLGIIMFEGESFDDRWDGTYKGDVALPGLYEVVLIYTLNKGNFRPRIYRKEIVVLQY